ncbi:hypothetical protein JCM10908_006157 [Rhodotorula pacifica]|uniref:Mho1p n=1 Tax=Rhodotorula pacifica TaxID=1495444 RepID=UPI0031769597
MPRTSTRTATHAGSWYTDNRTRLDEQLEQWLEATSNPSTGEPLKEAPVEGCKAIIAPHAGYSYSGPAAAFAYRCIDVANIHRVFVLGPSHHVYLDGCALSRCSAYETPIGQLPLDLDAIRELRDTGKFEDMDQATDEDEHSIEMHLPYIRKVFEGRDIKLVPILVGSISTSSEKSFGALLAPYLADPHTLFVVSSDFCHWGTRFRYTHYHPPESDDPKVGTALTAKNFEDKVGGRGGAVWQGIEKLDHLGMEAISFGGVSKSGKTATQAHDEFAAYLRQTKNTICGRHPIGVLLGALAALEVEEPSSSSSSSGMRCEWVRYEQSSHVEHLSDSSVSYASAFVAFA